jgi:hypothetical protein
LIKPALVNLVRAHSLSLIQSKTRHAGGLVLPTACLRLAAVREGDKGDTDAGQLIPSQLARPLVAGILNAHQFPAK